MKLVNSDLMAPENSTHDKEIDHTFEQVPEKGSLAILEGSVSKTVTVE